MTITIKLSESQELSWNEWAALSETVLSRYCIVCDIPMTEFIAAYPFSESEITAVVSCGESLQLLRLPLEYWTTPQQEWVNKIQDHMSLILNESEDTWAQLAESSEHVFRLTPLLIHCAYRHATTRLITGIEFPSWVYLLLQLKLNGEAFPFEFPRYNFLRSHRLESVTIPSLERLGVLVSGKHWLEDPLVVQPDKLEWFIEQPGSADISHEVVEPLVEMLAPLEPPFVTAVASWVAYIRHQGLDLRKSLTDWAEIIEADRLGQIYLAQWGQHLPGALECLQNWANEGKIEI